MKMTLGGIQYPCKAVSESLNGCYWFARRKSMQERHEPLVRRVLLATPAAWRMLSRRWRAASGFSRWFKKRKRTKHIKSHAQIESCLNPSSFGWDKSNWTWLNVVWWSIFSERQLPKFQQLVHGLIWTEAMEKTHRHLPLRLSCFSWSQLIVRRWMEWCLQVLLYISLYPCQLKWWLSLRSSKGGPSPLLLPLPLLPLPPARQASCLMISVGTTGPQPPAPDRSGELRTSQCRQIECQNICQTEC